MAKQQRSDKGLCPCGRKIEFAGCCGRFLSGDSVPSTAEELMRSRYSAFVFYNSTYLLYTWHPNTRPNIVKFDQAQRWLGLTVRKTDAGGHLDNQGSVEYIARFKIKGKGHRLHEISRFERYDNRWHYLDGEHR